MQNSPMDQKCKMTSHYFVGRSRHQHEPEEILFFLLATNMSSASSFCSKSLLVMLKVDQSYQRCIVVARSFRAAAQPQEKKTFRRARARSLSPSGLFEEPLCCLTGNCLWGDEMTRSTFSARWFPFISVTLVDQKEPQVSDDFSHATRKVDSCFR